MSHGAFSERKVSNVKRNARQTISAGLFSVLVLVALTPLDSWAQEKTRSLANRQYAAASKAFSGGLYREAALLFESAAQESPHSNAWLAAAQAWKMDAQLDQSATALWQAIQLGQLSRAQRRQAAKELELLRKALGEIDASVPNSPVVTVDSGREHRPPAKIFVLPGIHRIALKRGEESRSIQELSIERSERKDALLLFESTQSLKPPESASVILEPPPLSISETAAPPSTPVAALTPPSVAVSAQSRKVSVSWLTAGIVTESLGVGSLVASSLLWNQALGFSRRYEMNFFGVDAQRNFDAANRFQNFTNGALIIGLVLATAGAMLLLRGVWPLLFS
jgi:tetratricopeptide (TPR) repeat protein